MGSGRPKPQLFWASPEQCVPGVPSLVFFELAGQVYAEHHTVSESLPGSPPQTSINEVYVRPGRGGKPDSLVEVPTSNAALVGQRAAVSTEAKDGHGAATNFFITQKGYRPATREDIARVQATTAKNEAAAALKAQSKDPLAMAAINAKAMGEALSSGLKDMVKEAVALALAAQQPQPAKETKNRGPL
jgi:hypothetical protein